MSDTYTKLFSSITASTVWQEPAGTRLVWITMLAMADKAGCVWASVPGLARIANVTLDETVDAIATLTAPDKWSRTPDNEGRRIEAIDGGWRLLNHAKYRAIRSAEERAEYKRQWDRENRGDRPNAAHREAVTPDSPRQTPTNPTSPTPPTPTPSPTAEKDQKQLAPKVAKEPRSRGARLPQDWEPSPADLDFIARERPDLDPQTVGATFRDFWHAKTGQNATKADWAATWRNWVRNQRPPSRAPTGPPARSKVRTAYDAIGAVIEEMKNGGSMVPGANRARGSELPALGLGRPALDGNASPADHDLD
jgi:hypothetical protein